MKEASQGMAGRHSRRPAALTARETSWGWVAHRARYWRSEAVEEGRRCSTTAAGGEALDSRTSVDSDGGAARNGSGTCRGEVGRLWVSVIGWRWWGAAGFWPVGEGLGSAA
jgi:hypothetical protein